MIAIDGTHSTRRSLHVGTIPPPWPYDAAAVATVEQTVVHTQVSDCQDKSFLRSCVIRFLKADDIDALEELNELVLNHLPHPHILRRASRAELEIHINRRGRCIGAFVDKLMVGFSVLTCPRDDPDNLGHDLGFDHARRLRSCHFELSGVHPSFRGSNLHRIMNAMRANFAGASGYHYLFGTVSPLNPYSLGNHLAQGMTIRKLVTKYEGMDRYIIHRHYHERLLPPSTMTSATYRSCQDIAGQKHLLDKGYWGIGLRRTESRDWEVAYVPSSSIIFETASIPA
ncbi:MAG: hypothetical protein WCF85_16905 [Rhodospirillaceae bacterium]